MVQDVKSLIERIQKEGIESAQAQAKEIENKALAKAKEIVDKAKAQAENLLSESQDKIAKLEKGSEASLQQAGRDLLISLKKEILAMLDRIIVEKVHESLKPEELAKIISELIKDHKTKDKEQVIVSLKKEDREKIEKGLLVDLKEEVKNGIVFRSAQDIAGGFIISYDSGKSHFDFTDKALAECFRLFLKPKVDQIISGGPTE